MTPQISLDESPASDVNTPEAIRAWLRQRNIDEVECAAPDFAGIARGKVMPAAKFIGEGELSLPTSIFFPTITGAYAQLEHGEYVSDADLTLIPDYSTARAVPWASTPSVQIIHDIHTRSGAYYDVAPRSVLRRVLSLYEVEGWRPVVAPELEFYLTKPNTDPDYPIEPPVGRSGRQSASSQGFSISAVDEFESIIEHIYDYAEAQGLTIDSIIQESGAAQLEINLVHGDALALADEVFVLKRTIREAALRCGCYATFMAKPMESQPGSAMHIHMSVVDTETGQNIFSRPDGHETPLFGYFIGGQQRYFAAACLLAAPYVNSYRRLARADTSPFNLEWGVDNRATGLRAPVCSPKARRVENRIVGADSNPYLALAAVLACGYLGLKQRAAHRGQVAGDPQDRERDLPSGLRDAIALFADCEPLHEVLGPEFCRIYAAVKRSEYDEFMRVISPWEREHLLLNV